MCETTIRKKLKDMGLHLGVETEMYTHAKFYGVYEDNRLIFGCSSLEEVEQTFFR